MKLKITLLGISLYFCPPLFQRLSRIWYSGDFSGDCAARNEEKAKILRRRFWKAGGSVLCLFIIALLFGWLWHGALRFEARDWIRVGAAWVAVTAAVARGGWEIQSLGGKTVIERIDRGMYILGQIGAATLLIFILTF